MSVEEGFFASGATAEPSGLGMEQRIASYPWHTTEVGPMDTWPQSLKVAARLLVNTRHPMFIWWGPSLIQLYNDAYRETMGPEQHPAALGKPGRETWAEIWDLIGPQIDYVMAGRGATWHEDQLIPITRHGKATDVYWTYSFSPIDDESAPNGVGGVLVICRETTNDVFTRQQSDARYRDLFAAVDEGFCIVKVLFNDEGRAVDYVFLETNPAFVVQTGIKQAVGRSVRSLIPDLEAHWCTAFGHVALTGEPLWHEYETAALGRWYDVHAFRIDDPAHHHVAIVFNDVTAKRLAAQREHESELRFRAFVTASSDVVYRMNPDWSQMCQLDGQGFLADTPQPSRTWMDTYIHPADRAEVDASIRRAIETRSMFELEHRVRRADGGYGWTLSRAIPILNDDGDVLEWLGAASDVTRHREAIIALRQSEERNRRIVEGLADHAIFVTDLTGTVVDWTPAASTIFGWSPEEILGCDMAVLFTLEDRALGIPASEIAIARETGCASDDRWHVRRNGSRFLSSGTLRPLRDAAGGITGYIKIARDDTERLATKAALAASEALNRHVFDRLQTGLIVGEVVRDAQGRGVDWRYIDVNPAWESLVGVSREVAKGKTVREIFPTIEAAWVEDLVRAVDTGRPVHFERQVGALGRWFQGHCFPIGPERFATSFLDVTQRRDADSTLHTLHADLEARFAQRTTERNLLATLVETTDVFIQVVDRNFVLLAINRASADECERLFGVRLQVGDNLIDLLAPYAERQASVRKLWERALAGEEYTIVEAFHDGTDVRSYEFKFNALRDSYGTRYGAYLFAHDVTQQLRDQATLAENAARLRTVFETSDRLQALLTPAGVVLDANATLCTAIATASSDVVGRPFWDMPWVEDAPGLAGTLRDALATAVAGRTAELAVTLRRVAGVRSYDLSMRPICDVAGTTFAIAVEAVDTTHRHQVEDALRQSQKVEALGQLTGGIAHDFNNHLTVIRSSVELLRRTALPLPYQQRYIDAIASTSDRAAKLTGQLLAFARRQALSPEVFDVNARMNGMADMLRTVLGSRVSLILETSNGPWYVEADAGQFDNAIINLTVNARDAMKGSGTLIVHIDRADILSPCSSLEAPRKGWIAVSLTDTGCGIPADDLGRIFEPFFTTKGVGKGTGLGLSQLIGFARQSGGDVQVASTVGKGTTFTLCLPQAEASQVKAPSDASLPALAGRKGRVLIVEDNLDVGEFATYLLTELGFEAALKTDAEAALSLLEHEHASFDVVFSDVVMPGMDGVALGRQVRERWPRLPVVLTSGYSDVLADDAHHGFPLLHKPYSVSELSRIFGNALTQVE